MPSNSLPPCVCLEMRRDKLQVQELNRLPFSLQLELDVHAKHCLQACQFDQSWTLEM